MGLTGHLVGEHTWVPDGDAFVRDGIFRHVEGIKNILKFFGLVPIANPDLLSFIGFAKNFIVDTPVVGLRLHQPGQ